MGKKRMKEMEKKLERIRGWMVGQKEEERVVRGGGGGL